MQLLAAMQLRGSGTGPGQATAWLQAAAWLRMGPMAPGALDHGPYGPQGPGPKLHNTFKKHDSDLDVNIIPLRNMTVTCMLI